ncbi:MAG: MFS transporter [Legionella longbeachae]|nr:MFS transporter [Legionella longbeachae]
MNNKLPSLLRGWVIWFLPAFFMLYQYGIQVLPSIKIPYLQSHYLINDFEIGMLNTSYLLPYALLQIVAGILIDNYSVRKILIGAMLLFSFGTLMIFFSNQMSNYLLYVSGRFCMGAAASSGFIGTLYLANLWLPKKFYQLAVSLTEMMSVSGVFIIVLISNYLLHFVDWSSLILINFIFCLGLTTLFWLTIIDVSKSSSLKINTVITNFKSLSKNKNLWLCALYGGFAFAHMIVLTNVWRVDFLEAHYHLSQYDATITNGYIIVGYIIGGPLYGLMAMKTQKITLLIMISAIIEFVLLFTCHFVVTHIVTKIIFYFFVGFFTSAVTLCFSLIKRLVDNSLLATAIGLVNMLQLLLGMLLTPIVGELLDVFSGDYKKASSLVVLFSFFAVILSVLLWRRTEECNAMYK